MHVFPHFGIPTLDAMFRPPSEPAAAGQALAGVPNLCIMGPDGAGKSVLALHLASCYMADHVRQALELSGDARAVALKECPRIVYASTDLSEHKAKSAWSSFWLNQPGRRQPPFVDLTAFQLKEDLEVHLRAYPPPGAAEEDGFVAYVDGASQPTWCEANNRYQATVAFLDLASMTAGDDYGLLTRILAALSTTSGESDDTSERAPGTASARRPHLMIIDAVEGLEALVGELDAYGQRRTRRSRIAQLVRSAAGHCSLVFILEEPQDGTRLPEEFVADYVVRLRSGTVRDYQRRTVEVEKARGEPHVRGRHPIVIRGMGGSTTGDYVNWDEPATEHPYVHVFNSLHALYRSIMQSPEEAGQRPDSQNNVAFGIDHLDELLHPGRAGGGPGLPAGRVAALIGHDGTHKSRLGRAFLNGCFDDPTKPGVAVLLTTQLRDAHTLFEAFEKHRHDKRLEARVSSGKETIGLREALQRLRELNTKVGRASGRKAGDKAERRRLDAERLSIQLPIICRRLEIHQTPPAILFHIIEQAVERARSVLEANNRHLGLRCRKSRWFSENAYQIRLVIDDWSTIRATYPEVDQDPLFLPFLVQYLERHGISTLIIDSQPGDAEHIIGHERSQGLRALAHHHLYTWQVPFFGDYRVAIAAIPPIAASSPSLVRELRPLQGSEEALDVDPHFELYQGLVGGNAEQVPLRVRLYAETPAFAAYSNDVHELFRELFRLDNGGDIVIQEDPGAYERLRELCYLRRDTRLNHTLVYQIDEFWWQPQDQRRLHLRYLQSRVQAGGRPDRANDPFELYQPLQHERVADPAPAEAKRSDRFLLTGEGWGIAGDETGAFADRVPFTWDFGFLMCRRSLWEQALNCETHAGESIGRIWDALRIPTLSTQNENPNVGQAPPPTWRIFFECCLLVAREATKRGEPEPVCVFDLDLRASETLSCLVLEIWFSELARLGGPSDLVKEALFNVKTPRPGGPQIGLRELLKERDAKLALFRTFDLLGAVLQQGQIPGDPREFEPRRVRNSAVAARHWYSTATEAAASAEATDPLVPLRLPGTRSVRGDWFLSVAAGSRSPRLGFHVVDLLTSRRANLNRLQLGLGLPVRDIIEREEIGILRTALMVSDLKDDVGIVRKRHLLYGELSQLGELNGMTYLWRGRLAGYSQQAHIWNRWLLSVLGRWHGWLLEDPARQTSNPRVDRFFLTADLHEEDPIPIATSSFIYQDRFEPALERLHAFLSAAHLPNTPV